MADASVGTLLCVTGDLLCPACWFARFCSASLVNASKLSISSDSSLFAEALTVFVTLAGCSVVTEDFVVTGNSVVTVCVTVSVFVSGTEELVSELLVFDSVFTVAIPASFFSALAGVSIMELFLDAIAVAVTADSVTLPIVLLSVFVGVSITTEFPLCEFASAVAETLSSSAALDF